MFTFALAFTLGMATPTASLLLPLEPGDNATTPSDAAGVRVQLLEAMEDAEFINALPESKRDSKALKRCDEDIDCMLKTLRRRGADLAVFGKVFSTPTGFSVELQVLDVDGEEIIRSVEDAFEGDQDDADRVMRKLFAPDNLYAFILVDGRPEGAKVQIDGRTVGELPMEDPVRILAGKHKVRVQKKGYETQVRPFTLEFKDVKEIEMLLTATRVQGEEEGGASSSDFPMTEATLIGAGGTAIVAGAGVGLWSFLISRDVKRRAEVQQLVFPRDNDLVQRGKVTAWASSGLWVAGIALAGSGAALLFLASDDEEGEL